MSATEAARDASAKWRTWRDQRQRSRERLARFPGDDGLDALHDAERDIDALLAQVAAYEKALADAYLDADLHGRAFIAKLCDEHLDRSGALLGRIRDAALASARTETT